MRIPPFLEKPSAHVVLIALLGLLAYSNTFDVPFQWDEEIFIEKNPIVKNPAYFMKPSTAKGLPQYGAFKSRYIGYLTFALNYKIHGLDVTGYHVVNISIHIINALLVYFLVFLTFRTPFIIGTSLEKHSGQIALLSALFFVSHPVQTEAVTYIFQRLASLSAFFYLLALVSYIRFRLSDSSTPSGLSKEVFYAVSLISTLLAMKTKENAFTLPLAILLYDFLFFRGHKKLSGVRLMPFLLTLLIIPLTLIGIDNPAGVIIGGAKNVSRGYADIERTDYLYTQFRVILTYIRLLFLPVNQNVDYDYSVSKAFLDPRVLFSFLSLFALFLSAAYLILRSKHKQPVFRATGFGILWFFLTLSVESSVIPIPMVINEYRVYLPSAGAFMSIVTALFLLAEKLKCGKAKISFWSVIILTLVVFISATYKRNGIWESNISLWEDVVKKSPGKATGYYNLGIAYTLKGDIDTAIKLNQQALRHNPAFIEAYINLGTAFFHKNDLDRAIENYQKALLLNYENAGIHCSLGTAYYSKNLIYKAIERFHAALLLEPEFAEAHFNLGVAYEHSGFKEKAMEHYRMAIKSKPDYAEARSNLESIGRK